MYSRRRRSAGRRERQLFDGNSSNRLKAEEISLCVRVFSLAGAFDAITSDRLYRRASSFEVGGETIRLQARLFRLVGSIRTKFQRFLPETKSRGTYLRCFTATSCFAPTIDTTPTSAMIPQDAPTNTTLAKALNGPPCVGPLSQFGRKNTQHFRLHDSARTN